MTERHKTVGDVDHVSAWGFTVETGLGQVKKDKICHRAGGGRTTRREDREIKREPY